MCLKSNSLVTGLRVHYKACSDPVYRTHPAKASASASNNAVPVRNGFIIRLPSDRL